MSLNYQQLSALSGKFLKVCQAETPRDIFMLGLICGSQLKEDACRTEDIVQVVGEQFRTVLDMLRNNVLDEQTPEEIIKSLVMSAQLLSHHRENQQDGTQELEEDQVSPELVPSSKPPPQAASKEKAPPKANTSSYWQKEDQQMMAQVQGSYLKAPSSGSGGKITRDHSEDVDKETRMLIEKLQQEENHQISNQIRKAPSMDDETLKLIKQLEEQDKKELQQIKTTQEQKMECQICSDKLTGAEIYPMEGCDDIFHKDCLAEYVDQCLRERRVVIKCPEASCKNELMDIDIGIIAGKKKQQEYINYTLDNFVDTHGADMSWCPTPDCKYAFVLDETEFTCPLCKKSCVQSYCLNCRVPFHKGQSCKEFQITNTKDENDLKFEKFVKGKKFKMCSKCKFWVEKNQGCDHMTCRCGYQFCYKCGGKYMECECIKKQREDMQRRLEQQRERQRATREARKRGKRR